MKVSALVLKLRYNNTIINIFFGLDSNVAFPLLPFFNKKLKIKNSLPLMYL